MHTINHSHAVMLYTSYQMCNSVYLDVFSDWLLKQQILGLTFMIIKITGSPSGTIKEKLPIRNTKDCTKMEKHAPMSIRTANNELICSFVMSWPPLISCLTILKIGLLVCWGIPVYTDQLREKIFAKSNLNEITPGFIWEMKRKKIRRAKDSEQYFVSGKNIRKKSPEEMC